MKTVKVIKVDPNAGRACYVESGRRMSDFFQLLSKEIGSVKTMRVNMTSDANLYVYNTEAEERYLYRGEVVRGDFFIFNSSLQMDEVKEPKTTIEQVEENISC